MLRLIVIIAILLNTTFFAKAEAWPHYSIVQLAFKSEKVVVANLLTHDTTKFVFQTRDLVNKNADSDTLILENEAINRIFYPLKNHYGYEITRFENADSVIIYLNEFSQPVMSGFRLLRNGIIYQPQQWDSEEYGFEVLSDRMSWIEIQNRIKSSWQRVAALKKLRDIADPAARNQALFQFIEKEKDEFGVRCARNMDCGWELVAYKIFQWITEAGIMEDTWRTSQLRRQIHLYSDSYKHLPLRMLDDSGKSSFSSYEGVEFLFSKIFNEQLPLGDHLQALAYFQTALRVVFEWEKENPHYRSIKFQRKKQRNYLKQLLPLLYLKNDTLKAKALRSIITLAYPKRIGVSDRNEMKILSELCHLYANEPPSNYKADLAEFIVKHVSEQKWKTLTNSDSHLLISLGFSGAYFYNQKLYVPIIYVHGKETIKQPPTLHLESVSNSTKYSFVIEQLPLPLKKTYQEIQIDIPELGAGVYHVYLTGSAGQQNEYKWQSQVGRLEK